MRQSLRSIIAIVLYLLFSFFVLIPSRSAFAVEQVISAFTTATGQEWLQKNCSQVFDNKILHNTFIYLHYTPENNLQLGTSETRSGYVDYGNSDLESESFTPIPADSPLGACLLIDDSKIDFSYESLNVPFYGGYQFSSVKGAASGRAELSDQQAKLTLDSIVDLTGASQADKFHIGKDTLFTSDFNKSSTVDELYVGTESPLEIKASKANIYIATLSAEVALKNGKIIKTTGKYTFVCLSSIPSGVGTGNEDLSKEDSNAVTPVMPIEPSNPSNPNQLHPDNKPVTPNEKPEDNPSLEDNQENQLPFPPLQPPKTEIPTKPIAPPSIDKPKPGPLSPSQGNSNSVTPNVDSTPTTKPVVSLPNASFERVLSNLSATLPQSLSSQNPTLSALPEPRSMTAPTQPDSADSGSSTPNSARAKSVSSPASKVVSNETSPSNKITEWETQSAKVLLAAGSVVAVGGGCIYLRLIRKP